jgi:serine/threonine kinase PknH
MTSPPPDRGSSPEQAPFEGDPDADTGPLQVVRTEGYETAVAPTSFPGQVSAGDWPQNHQPPPMPVGESYASRFTAPLTVDPRAPKVKSIGIQPATVLAVVGVVILVAALVFLLIHLFDGPDADTNATGAPDTATSAKPADQDKLQRLLPQGYANGACTPADLAKGALAKVSCSANSDTGGPPSATYTLVGDSSALRTTFDGIVSAARQVNCPGNIQSPGPWRRNATPQAVAGTVFCGFRQDVPTVAWTNDADLLVSSVDGAQAGPSLDQLYTWWSSHS